MYIAGGSHVTGVVAVHAAPFLAAHVSAAVWNLAALPFGVRHFICNPKKEAMACDFHPSLSRELVLSPQKQV